MNIDEFINSYSKVYMVLFHKEEQYIPFSKKVANFLFEPRYKVKNLKFKSVE